MTIGSTYGHGRAALPAAAIAALLLAGCSSGNIGESWQCPLAETGSCDSVAAADPAVPDMGAARKTVLTEPLWRQRAGEPGPAAPAPCEAQCGGFDPFGWLMRLFGDGSGAGAGDAENAGPSKARETEAAVPAPASPATTKAAPAPVPPRHPAPAVFPAEGDDAYPPDGGDLRTHEVVARIWIAPFVDADGVYREASHVRVVLEPAGWRVK